MKKFKTLKPLKHKPSEIFHYIKADATNPMTFDDVLAGAQARWNRLWDLVDALQEPLGMDFTKVHAKLQACLDNGDFGEERKK